MDVETYPSTDYMPSVYRSLHVKNLVISKLYHYASGGTDIPPFEQIENQKDALGVYLGITAASDDVRSVVLADTSPPPKLGMLTYDPFDDSRLNFTEIDSRRAVKLDALIQERGARAGRIPAVIDDELAAFTGRFVSLDYVSEIDKADVAGALEHPHLRSLRDEIITLVSNFVIFRPKSGVVGRQYVRDEIVGTEAIGQLLESGFYAYAQTYLNDFHYYDTVYGMFDSMRTDGRRPQEVYIGRDGIYAYLGRRAQDTARQLRDGGGPAINPKYMVYQRFFRDHLDPGLKAEYLAYNGVTADSDPYFFDTGFTGTLPIDIMRTIGVDESEYDERIQMLASNNDARRIPGIDPGAWENIKSTIDYKMKTEEPSIGLIRDADGNLRNVALPTCAEEQFIFHMVRLCIERHYLLDALQEKL